MSDTIVAVASPPGGGPRGVVRLSGPQALPLARGMVEAELGDRGAVRTSIQLPDRLRLSAVVYVMPGPGSFTGEDVVELHIPGSPPILRLLVDTLILRGARAAGPGEFTMRAYLSGRIDLSQAEAVQNLIMARNSREVRAAREQIEGALAAPLRRVEEGLLDLCADVEAGLDFADQDMEIVRDETVRARAEEILVLLDSVLSVSSVREETRPTAVLYGAPNVGKSSLFNRLTGGRAIVSDAPGTTRDVLEGAGEGIRILDVAGQQVCGGVEALAVARARGILKKADLVLWVVDGGDADRSVEPPPAGLPVVLIVNKIDRGSGEDAARIRARFPPFEGVNVSAKTGDGISELRNHLRHLRTASSENREARFHVSLRQQAHLRQARHAVHRGVEAVLEGRGRELLATDLRAALDAVGAVTGRDCGEDLLTRVFARFCVGK